MSNRFDPTHKLASKQDAAIDALAARIEPVSGVRVAPESLRVTRQKSRTGRRGQASQAETPGPAGIRAGRDGDAGNAAAADCLRREPGAIGGVSVRVRGAVDVEGLVAVLNAIRRAS